MNRFFRTRRDAATPSQITDKPSKIEKALTALSQVSQVLMLAVVAWGYWYTVLPVFEKSLLAEQVSRLQLEQTERESAIKSQRETVTSLSEEVRTLEEAKKTLAAQVDGLNAKVAMAEESGRVALVRARKATNEAQLSEAKLVEQLTMALLGETALPASVIEYLNAGVTGYVSFF